MIDQQGNTVPATRVGEDEAEAGTHRGPEKTHPYDFSILRNLRKAQGFTIADIAQASGISTAMVAEPVLLLIRVVGVTGTEAVLDRLVIARACIQVLDQEPVLAHDL